MKSSLVSLFLLLSLSAHAGGTGEGFVNTSILSCGTVLPVKEGVASLSIHFTDQNTVRMSYSNDVFDFNVSFDPIKVVERHSELAELRVENDKIIAESQSGKLKMTLNPLDIVLEEGSIEVQLVVDGRPLTAKSCGYMLSNLRTALKL